jgi:hypothetical protein
MDNPNYLVLSDALRIQRPFNSQVSNPFTTAQSHSNQIPNINSYSQLTDSLMRNGSKSIFQLSDAKDLQNLSLVSGYSAHHLLGFQPHFLHHPAMVHGTNSGFFSSGGGAFVKPFPSSAFTPTKCLGLGLDQVCYLLQKTTEIHKQHTTIPIRLFKLGATFQWVNKR